MKRWRHIALWVPVGILLLIILAVMAALSAPVQTAIVQRVLDSVNNSIHGTLIVGKVHVSAAGVIYVRNAELKDPEGVTVASFDELRGRVDLWGLRDRTVRIYELALSDLRMDMAIDTTGKSNLERALSPRDTTKPPPDTSKPAQWIIQLDELEISGGPTYIHNPTDTLVNAEDWTLLADVAFKERKLDYHVEYDSPRQVHLRTDGSLVLADTIRDVQGKLNLRVDSTYSGGLYIPAQTVGRMTLDAEYKQRADSIDVTSSAQSSVLGGLHLAATMVFPPGVIAGHGNLTFEQLHPSSLWKDTTDLAINGQLAFVKDTANSIVNGWDVRIQFNQTSYGDYELRDADLRIVTKDSTASVKGELDTGHGTLTIDAFADGFDPERMTVNADVRMENLYLHEFVSQIPDSLSPVSGTVHVEAENPTADTRTIIADADLAEFSFGHYWIDAVTLRGEMHGDHVVVDTLALTGYGIALHASAAGDMGDSIAYDVQLEAPDLNTLQPLLAAMADSLDTLRGAVRLDLTGTVDLTGDSLSGLTAEGDIVLTDASYGPHYVKAADVRLVQFDYPALIFNGALSVDSAVVAGQRVDSADITATGDVEQFRMALQAWADTIYIGALFTARLQGDVKEVALDTLHAVAYGIEWWSETASVIRLEGERIEVDALTIRSEIGVLRASGYMQRHGDQDMAIELSGLKTAEIGRLLEKPLPESTTNIRVQFTGTDADLIGDLFVTADSIIYEDKVVADRLELQATANRHVTTIDGLVMTFGDTLGFFGGELPLQISLDSGAVLLKDSPMTGRAKLVEQQLDGFSPFMPSGTSLSGFISGDATFKGTPANPEWLGTFVVRDAHYRDTRTGVDYEDIDITGELVGDTLRIPKFDIVSVGKMSGSGSALMAFPLPKDVSLNLHMRRFEVMDGPQMRVRASGDVKVTGPLDALHAQGELEFDEVIYRLSASATKTLEEVNLDSVLAVMRGDTVSANEPGFSPSNIYRSMSHELHLIIPGNCWVRGSGMNIELTGDLWMYKDNGVDPTINGVIQTRQGDVTFLGKRFEVTSGTIRFEGPIGDPQLDITAEHTPPSTTTSANPLKVHVFGTVTETRFEFVGMTPEEAVNALLGGGAGGSPLSAEQIQSAATGTATGQLSGMIGKWAGLDVFEYRPGTGEGNNLSGGSLEVGTYVTERLFVRVTQPIEQAKTGQSVSVEYRLLDWLKLRAAQEASQNSALDLLIQLDWR